MEFLLFPLLLGGVFTLAIGLFFTFRAAKLI
ncbi:cytochrome b6-f complex subunit 6 [Phormidium sp. FACHB-592]|nr:cytochrome b6-f complex subunit 6 [Phormidium sp. FACHB-592]MBD2038402.1 cytochrome b6-f complex subunit 6 [Leptolyngbya sp. FACHB-321]MBD2077480.1 cytochrome b6-f complex subunit 6 [Phormidium sp. FACHB-592]